MSLLFGLSLSSNAQLTSTYIPLPEWTVQQGDRFIVDTQDNIGYVVHTNGDYTSIRVGSGKNAYVNYAGRKYKATTPLGRWTVKSRHIQSDRGLFGKSGRFLRLYFNGEEYTKYGIHSTGNIQKLLSEDDRYKSMGCILVNDEVLDLLEQTYYLNGEKLEIVTTYGINENLLNLTPNL